MTPPIDTRQVANFRSLRFDSGPQCLAEIDRLLDADRQGRLQSNGNWTPGQLMSHIAAWIEYGYDGYPISAPPFFIRWFLRLSRQRILDRGMQRGVRIPGIKQGTLGMEETDTAAAAQRLKAAFERLESDEDAKYDSPAFGAMSHCDRIKLNLRHAELHLGFLTYD